MAHALGEGVGVLLTAEEEGHGTYPQNRCVTDAVDRYLRTGRTPAPGDGVPGQHVLRHGRIRGVSFAGRYAPERPVLRFGGARRA